MLLVLVEQVGHREVVELQSHTSDDTRLSPTERELNLVVRLLFQVPVHIHGTVLIAGLDVGNHLFGVEVAHRGQLTCRTCDGFFREEVAGLGVQFAAHHILVETVVTVDAHMAQVGLLVLHDAYLQVDRVAHDVHFGGVDLREYITVVVVDVTHGVLVARREQSLVDVLLVVDVALLHVQDGIQLVGVIDGVAHPCDVAHVVFLSLVHLHVDVHVLVVIVPHAVFHYHGVAVTILIIFLQQVLLVFLPAVGGILLRFQEVGKLTGLMGLREGALGEELTLDFRVREGVVAVDDDVANLHLLFFVDLHIEYHLVLVGHIVALGDGDFGILESLIVEIALRQDLGTVDDVGMQRHTLGHAELVLHVLAFRLLQANVVDGRYLGARSQIEMQVHLVANQRVDGHCHLREQAVAPVALHGIGDFRAGNLYLVAYREG